MSKKPHHKRLRTLAPIREKPVYYKAIQERLSEFFKEEVFAPLLREIRIDVNKFLNSRDDLVSAIRSGQIVYDRGGFSGSFDAGISRELKKLGAVWDRPKGFWSIPLSLLPVEIKTEVTQAKSRYDRLTSGLLDFIKKLNPEKLAGDLSLQGPFEVTLGRIEKAFYDAVKGVTVPPSLNAEQMERIAKEYSRNTQLYIQDFLADEAVTLRKQVEAAVFKGQRYEQLAELIEKRYGVSQSKAKFLARQETSLLMTKYKQVRYQEAGLNRYIWRCVVGSSEHPVRPMHKVHDGKIYSWDKPPVVNEQGERKHPGQDFNCRCVAVPVLDF